MADQFGRAVTYTTPVSTSFVQVYKALYDWFLASGDPNWAVDATVTHVAKVTDDGDQGFSLVNTGGDQIHFSVDSAASTGGTMAGGSAIASTDDILVSMTPGGGTTDVRTGTFSFGARWDGWLNDSQGATYNTLAGRCKVSSTADWLHIRHKSTLDYDGGFFAGKLAPLASLNPAQFDGYCVCSGLWAAWVLNVLHGTRLEVRDGVWETCLVAPQSGVGGFRTATGTDGAGNYMFAYPTVQLPYNMSYDDATYLVVMGVLPCWRVGLHTTTVAQRYDDGAGNVLAVSMNGKCFLALDDGTDAE